jgi:hypothetical protein
MPFKNKQYDASVEQEKKIAKDIKGKRMLRSGAMNFAKGDVISDKYMVEAKYANKSWALGYLDIIKLVNEARRVGKIPIFQVQIKALSEKKQKWAIMPWDTFLELGDGEENK